MELPPLSGLLPPHIRGKTTIACDICRQRKSRCDGMRPRCSHCANAGMMCAYRPTPTNLETDESVLSRLADVESRLNAMGDVATRLTALEHSRAQSFDDYEERERKRLRMSCKTPRLPAPDNAGPALPELLRPASCESPNVAATEASRPTTKDAPHPAMAELPRPATPPGWTDHSDTNWPGLLFEPPLLHTASACQMLHSWPRLRVCLDDDVNPLKMLRKVDQEKSLFLNTPTLSNQGLDISLWEEVGGLEFHDQIPQMPAVIRYLFETGICMDKQALVNSVRSSIKSGPTGLDHFEPLSMAASVVLSMALPFHKQEQKGPYATGYLHGRCKVESPCADVASKLCLRSALKRYANMPYDTLGDRVALPLALAYSLAYIWARPFQALEVLQSIDCKLKRWSIRCPDDPHLLACCKLYVLLEGDILSEVDESCSETILFEKGTAFRILWAKPASLVCDDQQSDLCRVINHLVKSRNQMDSILEIYAPSRAYARPGDLYSTVRLFSEEVDARYGELPRSKQFQQSFNPKGVASMEMSADKRELGFRHFSSLFLNYRPILYFFLHQDLENNIQPSGEPREPIRPWVTEMCIECVEYAITAIYLALPSRSPMIRSWCDYQLLFAAYMVVLQVKGHPDFLGIFSNLNEHWSVLLNRVEEEFDKPFDKPLIRKTLETMKLLRKRFGQSHLQRVLAPA